MASTASLQERISGLLESFIQANLYCPEREEGGPFRAWETLSDLFHQDAIKLLRDRYLSEDEGMAWIACLPLVRRMGKIAQLPFVYIFCPTAEHSRYVHSLGSAALMAKFCEDHGIDPDLARDAVLLALLHDVFDPPFGHGLIPLIMLSEVYGDEVRGEGLGSFLLKDLLNDDWRVWCDLEGRPGECLKMLRDEIVERLGKKRIKRLLSLLSSSGVSDQAERLVVSALRGTVISVSKADYLVRDIGMMRSVMMAMGVKSLVEDLLSKLAGLKDGEEQVFRARDEYEADEIKEVLCEFAETLYRSYTHYYERDASLSGDEMISHLIYILCGALSPTSGHAGIKRTLLKITLLDEDQIYTLLWLLGEDEGYRLVRELVIKLRYERRVFPCLLEIGMPLSFIPAIPEHGLARGEKLIYTFMEHVKNKYCDDMEGKLRLERGYARRLITDLFNKKYENVYKEEFFANPGNCLEKFPLTLINLRSFYRGGRGLTRWHMKCSISIDKENTRGWNWRPREGGYIRIHVFTPEPIYEHVAKDEKLSSYEQAKKAVELLFELLMEGLDEEVRQRVRSWYTGEKAYIKWCGRRWPVYKEPRRPL